MLSLQSLALSIPSGRLETLKDQRESVGDLSGPHIPWEIEIRTPPLLGDAKVWMELADMLHRKNKILREGEQLNELSVANVCAGYAFEFVFKVLVEAATMEQAAAGHNPSDAYRILKEKEQGRTAEIDRIITRWRWNKNELLEYLDSLCHIDRKYWMRPPPPKDGTVNNTHEFYSGGGMKGFDVLANLHADLSDLARKWLDQEDEDEPLSGCPRSPS